MAGDSLGRVYIFSSRGDLLHEHHTGAGTPAGAWANAEGMYEARRRAPDARMHTCALLWLSTWAGLG